MKRLWVYVVYKRLFGKIRMTFFYDNYGNGKGARKLKRIFEYN